MKLGRRMTHHHEEAPRKDPRKDPQNPWQMGRVRPPVVGRVGGGAAGGGVLTVNGKDMGHPGSVGQPNAQRWAGTSRSGIACDG
jgi:hypothetical protein